MTWCTVRVVVLFSLLLGSLYLNWVQFNVLKRQQNANVILQNMVVDPIVLLAVNDETGEVLVSVNYGVIKKYPKVCPPQKRL